MQLYLTNELFEFMELSKIRVCEGVGIYMNDRELMQNVPCFVCPQCGEAVYSASVLKKIDDILDTLQDVASKIFIMDFEKAA